MALQSMTGFARHEANHEGTFWVWEIRSVNGKGLDLRMRLPYGFEEVEIAAKKYMASKFSRGNMQISLTMDNSKSDLAPKLNEKAVDALIEVAKEVQTKVGGEMPTVAEIMAIRGVVEIGEEELDAAAAKSRANAILESLKVATENLRVTREKEGEAVAVMLKEQLLAISELRDQIDKEPSRTPEAILQGMEKQIETLLKGADSLDPQRLHQEAVMIATKADLQEELDRLAVHLQSAKELMDSNGAVGRKLDFLAQEFHRECNTICSKSNAAKVTALGLDMKLIIDQFREQVQNME